MQISQNEFFMLGEINEEARAADDAVAKLPRDHDGESEKDELCEPTRRTTFGNQRVPRHHL